MATRVEEPVNALNPSPGYGLRIAHARLAVNKTKRDLAQAVDVTYGNVCRWENEQRVPTEENFVRVARATRVTAAYLIFGHQVP